MSSDSETEENGEQRSSGAGGGRARGESRLRAGGRVGKARGERRVSPPHDIISVLSLKEFILDCIGTYP